jgi:hypothetical protein
MQNEQAPSSRTPVTYSCLNCKHEFVIEINDDEAASCLDQDRTETCPTCQQQVGVGPVRCRRCGGTFELAFRHWHVHCDVASGECPSCHEPYQSLCIC